MAIERDLIDRAEKILADVDGDLEQQPEQRELRLDVLRERVLLLKKLGDAEMLQEVEALLESLGERS